MTMTDTDIELDNHWGFDARSIAHHADRAITRPGGPHRLDCGRIKRLAPVDWTPPRPNDRMCPDCEAIWS